VAQGRHSGSIGRHGGSIRETWWLNREAWWLNREAWWLNREAWGLIREAWWLNGSTPTVVLQSQVQIRHLPSPQLTANLLVGCYLGWHLAVG
jgi:hypothetical protein